MRRLVGIASAFVADGGRCVVLRVVDTCRQCHERCFDLHRVCLGTSLPGDGSSQGAPPPATHSRPHVRKTSPALLPGPPALRPSQLASSVASSSACSLSTSSDIAAECERSREPPPSICLRSRLRVTHTLSIPSPLPCAPAAVPPVPVATCRLSLATTSRKLALASSSRSRSSSSRMSSVNSSSPVSPAAVATQGLRLSHSRQECPSCPSGRPLLRSHQLNGLGSAVRIRNVPPRQGTPCRCVSDRSSPTSACQS